MRCERSYVNVFLVSFFAVIGAPTTGKSYLFPVEKPRRDIASPGGLPPISPVAKAAS